MNIKTKSKLMIGLYSILGIFMVASLFSMNMTHKGTAAAPVCTCSAGYTPASNGACTKTVKECAASKTKYTCSCTGKTGFSPLECDCDGDGDNDATTEPYCSIGNLENGQCCRDDTTTNGLCSCPSGYTRYGNDCELDGCPAGQYRSIDNVCAACSAGFYCTGGTAAPVKCPNGTTSKAGSSSCNIQIGKSCATNKVWNSTGECVCEDGLRSDCIGTWNESTCTCTSSTPTNTCSGDYYDSQLDYCASINRNLDSSTCKCSNCKSNYYDSNGTCVKSCCEPAVSHDKNSCIAGGGKWTCGDDDNDYPVGGACGVHKVYDSKGNCVCATGYSGNLCTECASGYHKSGDNCVADTGGNNGGGNGGGDTPTSTKPVKVYFSANFGTLSATNGKTYGLKSDAYGQWATVASGEYAVQTCTSGSSLNIWDYNGDGWLFSREGYIGQVGAEYHALTSDGKTYVAVDQSRTYTYNELVNISYVQKSDHYEVWLYVNWVKPDANETKECYVCVKNGTQYVMATSSENAAKGATQLSGVTADNCSVTDKSNCSATLKDNCYECTASGSTTKHVMATSVDEAKTKSGYVNCSIVNTDKCNSGGNPQTGTFGIIIAWVVALSTVGYAIWYFKKSSSIN